MTYKPTKTMLRVLCEMLEGKGTHHNVSGMSAHGGRASILHALYRHGFIDKDYGVTESGRQVAAKWKAGGALARKAAIDLLMTE